MADSTTTVPRTSGKAILSLVLGLLSIPLLVLTGVPAVLVGLAGLRDVNASGGRLRGRGFAVGGMVLGTLATLVTVLWVVAAAVNHLRAQSERVTCQHHLGQVARAVNLYYEAQTPGAFPPGTALVPDLPPERRLSWLALILPGVQREALYARLDLQKAWDAPENRPHADEMVETYLCPGAPDAYGSPLTHYVGLAGVGPEAAELPETSPRAGMFGYSRVITREDVAAGTSQVMLAAETNLLNGPWAAGGPATVRPLLLAEQPYLGPGQQFGGLHPGGANVAYVDGSVRFITTDVNPVIFAMQVTISENKDLFAAP